jgi:hypothetical protein
MAMQKSRIGPKNHVHWSLSAQVERVEMLILPRKQRSTLHTKLQDFLSPNFCPEFVPTPRLPLTACVSNETNLGLGGFLGINSSLLAHSSENDNVGVLAILNEHLVDLVANLTIRDLDIILGRAIVGHEREETVVSNVEKLVLLTANVGDVHVVGGGAEIFKLLGGEDVDGNQMDLGVTVLAGLRGGHLDNFARTVLDDDETILPQSRTLHGEGLGGTGIGALEGVLMLRVVRHGVE